MYSCRLTPVRAAARTCWSASMKPISRALTRILNGPPSPASTLVSAMPAARVTAVGPPPGRGALAPILSVLMTRPQRRSLSCGHTSRVSRMAANSFWSKSSRQISSVICSNGALRDTPALFKRISILPKAAMVSSKARRTSETSATSPCTARTRPRAVAPMLASAWSRPSRPRATMATSAPDAANRVATASPTPLLPPVTTAALPARLISTFPSLARPPICHYTAARCGLPAS